jgi:Uma2 family endonuclease
MASVAGKLITADEFYDWVHRPENRDRCFELEEGEIVEMPLPGERHGVVCSGMTALLWNYAQEREQGYVCANDTGIVLQRDPDTVRGPDVAFYAENREYEDLAAKYAERIPTLVVEVLSPSDRIGKMIKRINQFLARGVAVVWLLDPESRNVTVFQSGRPQAVLETDEELAGIDALPGFRCKVQRFFAMPFKAK